MFYPHVFRGSHSCACIIDGMEVVKSTQPPKRWMRRQVITKDDLAPHLSGEQKTKETLPTTNGNMSPTPVTPASTPEPVPPQEPVQLTENVSTATQAAVVPMDVESDGPQSKVLTIEEIKKMSAKANEAQVSVTPAPEPKTSPKKEVPPPEVAESLKPAVEKKETEPVSKSAATVLSTQEPAPVAESTTPATPAPTTEVSVPKSAVDTNAVSKFIEKAEKSSGILFSKPDVSGTFERMKDMTFADMQALAIDPGFNTKIQQMGITQDGWNRWSDVVSESSQKLAPIGTETLANYVGRLTSSK